MIFCVWYPSGGFGHYINAVLSIHGKNFKRPKNSLTFSNTGDSHSLNYIAPPYSKNQAEYKYDFDPALNYSVIVDNGINNESTEFVKFFPGAHIIKLCYSERTWPVVAKTLFAKAMKVSMDQELQLDSNSWIESEPWSQREKYFLFLRDHALRQAWKPSTVSHNLLIDDLVDYNTLCKRLTSMGIEFDNFEAMHDQWWQANQKYFEPITQAEKFISQHNCETPTDLWTQAVAYYQIWCRHAIEVPHNDFSNFFADQTQFRQWLRSNL